jgi:hypothetical protein
VWRVMKAPPVVTAFGTAPPAAVSSAANVWLRADWLLMDECRPPGAPLVDPLVAPKAVTANTLRAADPATPTAISRDRADVNMGGPLLGTPPGLADGLGREGRPTGSQDPDSPRWDWVGPRYGPWARFGGPPVSTNRGRRRATGEHIRPTG